MLDLHVRWLQLLTAAGLRHLLGALWYSPFLFGPLWARMNECSQRQMRRRLVFMLPLEFLCSFIIAFVLAQVLNLAGALDWVMGALVGFLAWLGFIAASTPNQVLYACKPLRLWMIDAGFCLASLLVMGVLIATWHWDQAFEAAFHHMAALSGRSAL
jgi:Protein of unknown function (DUF1761)